MILKINHRIPQHITCNFTGSCQIFFVADIDFAHRKIGSHLSPTKIIIQDGENFMIKTQSTFKSYEFSFTVGVETEEFTKGLDNRILKVRYHLLLTSPMFFMLQLLQSCPV